MPRAHYTAEGGTYRIAGQSFEPGDELEVDRETAEHLADVEDFEVIVEKDDAAPQEEDKPPDVPILAEDATVAEIENALDGTESPDAIRYILEDEREGQNRKTAINALEARLNELEG